MTAYFLTGGSGFIGSHVARWLVNNTEDTIVALVRAEDEGMAGSRLERAWWDWPELKGSIGSRVEPVAGDITLGHFGLEDSKYNELIRATDRIIHTAADIRLNAPLDELRRTNVEGVRNVLRFADDVHRDHGLARFSHVSTAYVAGRRQGTVREEELTDRNGFLSSYEQSKFEGETLVREAGHLPISVFRPGMVVGSSENGHVRTFNTLYYPLRLYLTGKLRVFPISPSQKVNLVPVDYVAEAIARLTIDPRAEGRTFHLVGAADRLPDVRQMVDLTRIWAKENLGVDLPRPFYFSPAMGLMGLGRSKGLGALAPYLMERREFGRENVDQLLGPYKVDWHDLLPRLLEFGAYNGFLHRTERTVHEQVLFRLRSKNRPVRLFDIVDGSVISRPAEEVRDEMLQAAASLRSLGIAQGDHVAMVGTNGTRYLTLDVAIGLLGAVSVPLYYTSPPRELDELIGASGAKLLLIGSDSVMKRIGEMATPRPIVSFCRSVPENARGRVIAWEDFLRKGVDRSEVSPAGFGDLATMRYTSGTTGKAKGVLFNHGHLRYMAESTASLPPWKARNSEVHYLSFLPMNHVVEGILATYSPFYAPTSVNIYFLEDFKGLRDGLAKVRPTVFFSIPRFYEKMLDGMMDNVMARSCLDRPDGAGKRLMAPMVRRRALKLAGLDRCRYLISGSGPIGAELLASLHGLGIEVHNAYGLTEAPLVSINYPRANRLGTVGEPLPLTDVVIAGDGAVLVRGPQVTCGYFGETEQPFVDGYLRTGDVGRLTPEGSLVLDGRKKELIKTAYGKFVNPLKVESMLRDLPGVNEAMLVGEGRPFCVALIWLDKGASPEVDPMIERMNADLSHPEAVKAWALLPNDLSIDGGDLTANMKLRRTRVMERYAQVIESLYSGSASSQAIHIGRAVREI
jgi:long-chain acyl-CoA synthetase